MLAPGDRIYESMEEKRKRTGFPAGMAFNEKLQAFLCRITVKGQHENKAFFLSTCGGYDQAEKKALKWIKVTRAKLEKLTGKKPKRKRRSDRKDSLGHKLPMYMREQRRSRSYEIRAPDPVTGVITSKSFSRNSQEEAYKEAIVYYDECILPDLVAKGKRQFVDQLPTYHGMTWEEMYDEIKRTTTAAGRLFKLSKPQFYQRACIDPCFFCGKQPSEDNRNGMDRLDNSISDYLPNNTVGACAYCNKSKSFITVHGFLGHCLLIWRAQGHTAELPAKYQKFSDEILHPSAQSLSRIANEQLHDVEDALSVSTRYSLFASSHNSKGWKIEITLFQFRDLVSSRCDHCHREASIVSLGLDRIDSSRHCTLDNIVPACQACNWFKNTSTKEKFVNHCGKILRFHGFAPMI